VNINAIVFFAYVRLDTVLKKEAKSFRRGHFRHLNGDIITKTSFVKVSFSYFSACTLNLTAALLVAMYIHL